MYWVHDEVQARSWRPSSNCLLCRPNYAATADQNEFILNTFFVSFKPTQQLFTQFFPLRWKRNCLSWMSMKWVSDRGIWFTTYFSNIELDPLITKLKKHTWNGILELNNLTWFIDRVYWLAAVLLIHSVLLPAAFPWLSSVSSIKASSSTTPFIDIYRFVSGHDDVFIHGSEVCWIQN